MRVRDWLKKLDSLRYIVDKMAFSSQVGRDMFFDREYSSDTSYLQNWYESQTLFEVIAKENNSAVNRLKMYISEIKDIRSSISSLNQGLVISEVEFFEIKKMAYYSDKIRVELELLNYKNINVESLSEIFEILDPQKSKAISFYIYDDYSERLKGLRGELKRSGNENIEQLYSDIESVQIDVLTHLSKIIREFAPLITRVIENIANIDFVVCATALYKEYSMVRIEITDNDTDICSMFNPLVKDRVEGRGGEFQTVDISFKSAPTLICGANMSGKSVILNSVALCQLLCQFGMFVTASKANIALKDSVLLSLSEENSLDSGLSSFAKEILTINSMIESVNRGENPLILIDEAARTTNPVEGVAIVSAIIEIFDANSISSLITTHYSGIKCDCRFLRVKGVKPQKINEKITADNINKYIDYSLEECKMGDAPQEAITIAEMLAVNVDFIAKSKKYLKCKK